MSRAVDVRGLSIAQDRPFTLIAGPCAIESRDHALTMAAAVVEITTKLGIPLIFKASYDKANRTSASSGRGVGMAQGLAILAEIRERHGCPVITDVHGVEQCAPAAQAVDVLQIPAFLCRQSDLLEAAARTGRVVNVKKGQFLAPWDMINVTKKLESFGASGVMVTERGTSFGYNTLVTDFRGLVSMRETNWPIVFDATHSVQQPGGQGGSSGGQREFVPVLARAAVALGVAAIFMETHDNPAKALSDGPNQVPLERLAQVLDDLRAFDSMAKARSLVAL